MADKDQSAKRRKMLRRAAVKLPLIHMGQNATVKSPQFDRSTTDPHNVMVVVMAEVSNTVHTIFVF